MIGVADVGAEEDLAACLIEGTQLLGRPAYKSLSIGGRGIALLGFEIP